MAAKKTKKVKEEVDEVLISMRERYFRLYAKEDIGQTKDITKTLDKLEAEIRKRMK